MEQEKEAEITAMYYVNVDQIKQRLAFVPELLTGCTELEQAFSNGDKRLITYLAQERVLHLAIETVTDVGSLIIDGFLMRDASSYEDIIDILGTEKVFSEETTAALLSLVKLRRPLVQEYDTFSREGVHPLLKELPVILPDFTRSVEAFIEKEMI